MNDQQYYDLAEKMSCANAAFESLFNVKPDLLTISEKNFDGFMCVHYRQGFPIVTKDNCRPEFLFEGVPVAGSPDIEDDQVFPSYDVLKHHAYMFGHRPVFKFEGFDKDDKILVKNLERPKR